MRCCLINLDCFCDDLSSDTAFKQQRLKAWQPILTPKTVLPTFILIGILFAPLGGLLLWASDTVAEIVIDYTKCDKAGLNYVPVPSDSFSAHFPGTSGDGAAPEYKSKPGVGSANNNHRRYVKSLDSKQLSGVARSAAELKAGSCDPLAVVNENGVQYPIYPCGLIANSVFNDTLDLFLHPSDAETNQNKTYIFSDTDIAWPSDSKKYGATTYQDYSQIRPPPNWRNFANGYSESSPPINVTKDQHFQVWMRTADYNVTSYGGTKSLVLSTASFMGGRNPFLGIAYVVVGVLCVVLGLLFTARHLYKPRRLGDHTYLSWNQNAASSNALATTAGVGGASLAGHGAAVGSTATTTGANARY
ncbi:hypothetical protein BGW38_000804 [Lunasporangiospora selenospora]|uniref:Uncharacterized protein n=1 Tax=Lunasporangiospora selenospora TaxID=979761 RepID=A0A9P6FWH9_9FUNG|nr:hypothetical protein BGW38_000804 [Lunasporangiospora selenospora]